MEYRRWFDGKVELGDGKDVRELTLGLPAGGGVGLLVDVRDRPVLLIYAANLRAVVRRRLEKEPEEERNKRVQLREVTAGVYFCRGYSGLETRLRYFELVRRVYPQRWREFFPRLRLWYLHVDMAEELPILRRIDMFRGKKGLLWGPFATKKSTDEWLETVRNLFGLCRCPEVLAQTPKAVPCAYAEMGRCRAVCAGKISVKRYRDDVQKAIEFLKREPWDWVREIEQEMRECAQRLEFETAERLKGRLDQVQKLMGSAGQWVQPMERFMLVSFQKGPTVYRLEDRKRGQCVVPFVIGPGWVRKREGFLLEEVEDACEKILKQVRENQGLQKERDAFQEELFTWAVSLLTRKKGDTGLTVQIDGAVNTEELVVQVQQHFSKDLEKKNQGTKPKLDGYSLTKE